MRKKEKIRLYLSNRLYEGCLITLSKSQFHYVRNVMRAKRLDTLLLFNGQDGEWLGKFASLTESLAIIEVFNLIRAQTHTKNLTLCFAPIKTNAINDIIRQATEMGVTRIQPILTERTIIKTINEIKFKMCATEAAEQCERLDIPDILPICIFQDLFKIIGTKNNFVLCDETRSGKFPKDVLKNKSDIFLIIGPEGGFSQNELDLAEKYCAKMSLGERILKVDTAVVCALGYVNEYYNLS